MSRLTAVLGLITLLGSVSCGAIPGQQAPSPSLVSNEPAESAPTITAGQASDNITQDVTGVELMSVGVGDDHGFIIVYFKAPVKVAQDWWQGNVYVTDEKTGISYKEVPVMPVVGPLLGKPKEDGQVGYVMLRNMNWGINHGSVVTVRLGGFKQEHVVVDQYLKEKEPVISR